MKARLFGLSQRLDLIYVGGNTVSQHFKYRHQKLAPKGFSIPTFKRIVGQRFIKELKSFVKHSRFRRVVKVTV